jgi:Bacterial protein of unknown function (DUF885)
MAVARGRRLVVESWDSWYQRRDSREVIMTFRKALPICFLIFIFVAVPLRADDLADLARDFWAWRAAEQPVSGDDIPRIERPADWTPDWSPATVAKRRADLAAFEDRWKKLDVSSWPVAQQVDDRLIGSALERVRWELDVTRSWQRNPRFYVQQTLGSIFELLIQPPPFGAARSAAIVRRLKAVPRTVEDAETNLSGKPGAAAPFARLAIAGLKDVRPRLLQMARALSPLVAAKDRAPLREATTRAIAALESYRQWLELRLPAMPEETAVGRDNYVFFLKHVALMPFTPEELLSMGEQEWARAVAFETYEEHRDERLPKLKIFPNAAAQINREAQDELAVRRFLAEKKILTIPSWVHHYTNRPLPDYMAPLAGLSVTDDLTGPNRLQDDGIHYIPPPSPELGYFDLAAARDPRVMIVHEGIPGHYLQLVLSWRNRDPIRRHYYDSGANEGIAFYAEEMMLEAGLFDSSPRSREIIYNFMRLRALRVEADVKLALGLFTISQAADFLRRTVPMDAATAESEASFFAASPGQAISYEIGKLQILKFLADARRAQGDKFSLQEFHDFVWENGNVPMALQRWEYLGLKDEITALDSGR